MFFSMRNTFVKLLCIVAGAVCSSAQSPVQLVRLLPGPPVRVGVGNGNSVKVDIDRDGAADFNLVGSAVICTMDIPSSACSGSIYLVPLNGNEILAQDGPGGFHSVSPDVAAVPPETEVGPSPFAETRRWTNVVTLSSFFTSPRNGTSGWSGPVTELTGSVYFGIRLQRPDGWHYGWVRARIAHTFILDGTLELADWAYESQPNVAIRTAAIPPVAVSASQSPRVGHLRLRWETDPTVAYQAQFTDDFDEWQNFGFTVIGLGAPVVIDIPATAGNRFYRVVRAQ
jgi:hypothetical protein